MTGWQYKLDAIFDEITFFFSLPLLSSIPAAADNNIHTRISGSEQKKMRFSFFFSFTLFYFSLYSATPVAAIRRWCSCFLENDITEREKYADFSSCAITSIHL
jgi:hypothetical protein